MFEIAIIGNISCDLIVIQGRHVRTMIGGGALNVGIGCRLAGIEPYLISVIGSDIEESQLALIRSHLNCAGVLQNTGPSCTFRLTYEDLNDPPQILCDIGASRDLTRHACEALADVRHVHVCCRWPLESAKVLGVWHERNVTSMSVDFIHSSIRNQFAQAVPFLKDLQYVFVNDTEMRHIREVTNNRSLSPLIIVTSGNEGAMAIQNNQVKHIEPVVPVEQPLDTSGAGDVYAGAFLGCMLRGMDLKSSMCEATALAARSVSDFGALHLLRDG